MHIIIVALSISAELHCRLATAIAQDVTVLDNLEGIPNAVNTFKKQVFTGNLTGVGNPSQGDDATYFNFFGPAIQKYLSDNKQALYNGVVNNLGDTLSSIGDNNADVKSAFTSYAQLHYQGAIDFLSTWSGKPFSRPPPTTTAAPVQTSVGPPGGPPGGPAGPTTTVFEVPAPSGSFAPG